MENIISWTGGSTPRKLSEVSIQEKQLVSAIFRENMKLVFAYWGDYRGLNNSVLESARIHYNRARHDAHATIRHNTK